MLENIMKFNPQGLQLFMGTIILVIHFLHSGRVQLVSKYKLWMTLDL